MNLKIVTSILAAFVMATGQEMASPSARPQIRGVVLHSGTKQPVAEAEISVSIRTPGPVMVDGGWKVDSHKLKADYRGAFTLTLDKLSAYRIEAHKDGYVSPGTSGSFEFVEIARPEP